MVGAGPSSTGFGVFPRRTRLRTLMSHNACATRGVLLEEVRDGTR